MTVVVGTLSRTRQFYHETAEDVLAFYIDKTSDGAACALAVITAITGGSTRNPGTLIAVAEDGEMAGYASNGCIDADLRLQALDAITERRGRRVLYGAGSPYIDLKLPCGGSIDVLIDPDPDRESVAWARAALLNRAALTVAISPDQRIMFASAGRSFESRAVQTFQVLPRLQLVLAGTGAALAATARLAAALDLPMVALSPDQSILVELADSLRIETFPLIHARDTSAVAVDPWTAVLLLFHDHDRELDLLTNVLGRKPLYVGALGSAKTHSRRVDRLRAAGVPEVLVKSVRGPIGLFSSARNATHLAASSLAEIVASYVELLRSNRQTGGRYCPPWQQDGNTDSSCSIGRMN